MNHEDYCSYELSMKLKDKGLDLPCYNFWGLEPDGNPIVITLTLGNVRNSDLKGRDVAAPFLWQVQKWLREKRWHIQVMLNGVRSAYFVRAYELIGNGRVIDGHCQFDNYEEALAFGINMAIEQI